MTALLVTGEEAVTVQEVGPSHFNGLKGVATIFPQRVARATARLDDLVVLTARGEHGAPHQPYVRGALPVEQAMDDTQ